MQITDPSKLSKSSLLRLLRDRLPRQNYEKTYIQSYCFNIVQRTAVLYLRTCVLNHQEIRTISSIFTTAEFSVGFDCSTGTMKLILRNIGPLDPRMNRPFHRFDLED